MKNNHTPISPSLYFSSAQLNILSLSIFLARALHVEHKGKPVSTILIDDPIQSMDSINVLATIDLLRNISIKFDKQIILSTHDENFHELLKLKIQKVSLDLNLFDLVLMGKLYRTDNIENMKNIYFEFFSYVFSYLIPLMYQFFNPLGV